MARREPLHQPAAGYFTGEGVDRNQHPDLDALLALIDRPAWQRDALCKEYPGVNFYPERGESLEPARQVCARCPVRAECEEYAVTMNDRYGVWGGKSRQERRQVRRSRREAA